MRGHPISAVNIAWLVASHDTTLLGCMWSRLILAKFENQMDRIAPCAACSHAKFTALEALSPLRVTGWSSKKQSQESAMTSRPLLVASVMSFRMRSQHTHQHPRQLQKRRCSANLPPFFVDPSTSSGHREPITHRSTEAFTPQIP